MNRTDRQRIRAEMGARAAADTQFVDRIVAACNLLRDWKRANPDKVTAPTTQAREAA